MTDTQKPAKGEGSAKTAPDGFTEDERAAMKERARELKSAARRNPANARAEGEAEVQAKIAEMPKPDRAMAERLHALITATAPELMPRTWYGMPAYAKDGKVLCFFQAAGKFKARYSTLGFSDTAMLDDGNIWPTTFALTELTSDVETRITALVKKAVG